MPSIVSAPSLSPQPSDIATLQPSEDQTLQPNEDQTSQPSSTNTIGSASPTQNGTPNPSISSTPSENPSELEPSSSPSFTPTSSPTLSSMPTKFGTTKSPTVKPSLSSFPSSNPSVQPTTSNSPSLVPSEAVTLKPSEDQTLEPSEDQTLTPSATLTISSLPSLSPSESPTLENIYRYSSGKCPEKGELNVPCSDPDLRKICDRYHPLGSFETCWNLCKPSFCCIHDAQANDKAVSCSTDSNCAQYAYCYIVWFHFHDTFGPATYLDIEQDGAFFDVDNSRVQGVFDDDSNFFDQLYFHHFDDVAGILTDGTDANGNFDYATIFEDVTKWQLGRPSNREK
jgi:hypothetical protein